MGKALLLLVAGFTTFSMRALFAGQEAANQDSHAQLQYEEGLIAYQIARSAYNAAYAEARSVTSLAEGRDLVHGRTGAYLGGRYEIRAEVEGSQIILEAIGYYGGRRGQGGWSEAVRRVGDTRLETGVFVADPANQSPRRLHMRFLRSTAGYCSAVFLQQFTPDGPDDDEEPDVQPPQMVYESGHYRNGETTEFQALIPAGAQLNFFIGVDQNCSSEPRRPQGMSDAAWAETLRALRAAATFDPAEWNYVHHALDMHANSLESMVESPWAFVQQRADGGERWRIGFEDIHNESWLTGTTRETSLALTKQQGFDGGTPAWPDRYNDWTHDGQSANSADGYGDLRDYGSRPDYDDQVVEVWMTPEPGMIAGHDDGDD